MKPHHRTTNRSPLPLALAAAMGAALLVVPATAQDEKPKRDPLIEQGLEQLDEALQDKKAKQDAKAIKLLGTIGQRISPDSHKKDLKDVVKAVSRVFFVRPQRPPNMAGLYRAAAETLAATGEDGAAVLMKVYGHSSFADREYIPMRAHILEQIGIAGSGDAKVAQFLLDIAFRSPEDALIASAGGALQHFTNAPLRTQRNIVDKLITRWEDIDNTVRNRAIPGENGSIDLGAEVAEKQLQALRGPWNHTIRTLTGAKIASVQEWRQWLNKNPRWEPPKKDGEKQGG